jgi:thymidine kinase
MSLEIVIGSMFSGKSSYALSYIRKQTAIGRNVVAVKPSLDTRYSQEDEIVTHNQDRVPCVIWDSIVPLTPNRYMLQADCVVVEEAQFFTGLPFFCEYMLGIGIHVVLVGLDGDAHRKPFREILDCIPWATKVTKLNALCSVCRDGTEAPYTRYKPDTNPSHSQIDVGGADKYQAVCLRHLHGKGVSV